MLYLLILYGELKVWKINLGASRDSFPPREN